MTKIDQAQQNINYAFYGGAPGIISSALAWLLTGIVAITVSSFASIVTLYVAGTFIFPASVVICKLLGRPGKQAPENSLAFLGLESTGIIIFGYPIAYAASLVHEEWFFPAMLILIGARYFVFNTIYGNKMYWLLGLVLIVVGYGLAFSQAPFITGAFAGCVIELIFGIYILLKHRKYS